MLRKSVSTKNFNKKIKELNSRLERLEERKLKKKGKKDSVNDQRLDKVIPIIVKALALVLGMKGANRQKKELIEEVREVL